MTSEEVRNIVKKLFPSIEVAVWLTDPDWSAPSLTEATNLLVDVTKSIPDTYFGLYECEDRAISIMGNVRSRRATQAHQGLIPNEKRKNWPLGIAMGQKFDGEQGLHVVNVFISDGKMYFFDSQTQKIREADKHEDRIFFILM